MATTEAAHELRIMDRGQGDVKIEWDLTKPDEVALARKSFDAARAQGMLLYSVHAFGGKGEVMREFDPKAEQIIAAPHHVGG